MSRSQPEPSVVVNSWLIHAHPRFLDAFEALIERVERLRTKDPAGYKRQNAAKRLAAIVKLAFGTIPQDPTRPEYRQGMALGEDYKHWFRAKFFQQYRLFFRYHRKSKVIVYGWVNDEDTKRAYESGTDAYRTFRRMIESGNPPDDWETLLKQAKMESLRLRKAKEGAS